jgi:hypothetical protein
MGRAGSAVRDDAVGRIYQVFRIQAAVLAYADIFMYAGIIAFIMIPLSFLVAHKMPAEVISSSRGCSALTVFRMRLAS